MRVQLVLLPQAPRVIPSAVVPATAVDVEHHVLVPLKGNRVVQPVVLVALVPASPKCKHQLEPGEMVASVAHRETRVHELRASVEAINVDLQRRRHRALRRRRLISRRQGVSRSNRLHVLAMDTQRDACERAHTISCPDVAPVQRRNKAT